MGLFSGQAWEASFRGLGGGGGGGGGEGDPRNFMVWPKSKGRSEERGMGPGNEELHPNFAA